jgi:hypothetical protein
VKELALDLSFVPNTKGILVNEGSDAFSFNNQEVLLPDDKKLNMTINANGGFLLIVE